MQKIWLLFISLCLFFLCFKIFTPISYAATKYTCDQEGQTAGQYTQVFCSPKIGCHNVYAGTCGASEVCDSKATNSAGAPCAAIDESVLDCICKDTTTFTCGVNGATNDFTRACGTGEVCDNTVLAQPGRTDPWPCTSQVNPSNAPTGTTYNPCPNGICDTAIGPINTGTPSAFIQTIFSILLSISGAVALILVIVSGYQLSLSQGNPEKVKGARERLTAAIIGLVFVIFSVAILQIIGFDILHLPGFSK